MTIAVDCDVKNQTKPKQVRNFNLLVLEQDKERLYNSVFHILNTCMEYSVDRDQLAS